MTISGFNVGGISLCAWQLNLNGVTDDRQMTELLGDMGYTDAKCASAWGGQFLRVLTNCQEIANSPDFTSIPFIRDGETPLLQYLPEEKFEHLDRIDRLLDGLLAGLADGRNELGEELNFAAMDAYFGGVAKLNPEQPHRPAVRILLTFVEIPPRWILDTPSADTCRRFGRGYSFESLWHKWIQCNIKLTRQIVEHCIDLSRTFEQDLLGAVEMVNEPDYEWLPDEYRIEKSRAPAVNPLGKYVTELHLNQIPDRETSCCIEATPWGTYGLQDGEWKKDTVAPRPLLDFPWGAKFDWYVKAFADFHTHMSWAVRDVFRQLDYKALVVSCPVTHNNILYFAQMYRANPETFAFVDAVALHPYHFPGHNIWDERFIGAERYPDWKNLTPRTYARECFKRFDFIEEIAKLTAMTDAANSFGLAGKKIWVTEFGVPTKVPGKFNLDHPEYVPFIRRRADPPPGKYPAAVWEDLWDAFFRQVTPEYLAGLGVDAFFLYALRETTMPGFDKHDDDRSNFALLTREGEPRMGHPTADGFRNFFEGLTGAVPTEMDSVQQVAARIGEIPEQLDSPQIHDTTTMLSRAEKRLLYFLTRYYFSDKGAIVDAGCFLGGSTVALAQGLLDRTGKSPVKIHSFDLFLAEAFTTRHYLTGGGFQEGSSFLGLYEKNIENVRDLVEVHAGDICRYRWEHGPIEILFIDIAKSWSTNDYLVMEMFPHLIPGHSIVVQQDYVHEWCPWLHVTMEKFAEYFTRLGFIENNTMVYRYERKIPAELLRIPVSGCPAEEKAELMHRSVNRFYGRERGLVECAEVVLLCELGRTDIARHSIEVLEKRFAHDKTVSDAITAVRNCLSAAAPDNISFPLSTCDLLSLDVFDTAILRTVSAPTDVFVLVKLSLISRREALLDHGTLEAFPALRVEAERSARRARQEKDGASEVTLDEIYHQLSLLSGAAPEWLAVLKETELEIEMRVAYPNPVARRLWEAALSADKKVVFCSDMYLSSPFILRLLEKCGYDRHDGLYVSCEHEKSKHKGTFYEYVAARHGVPLDRVLHIGDNPHSDCVMARQAGCVAVHLPLPAPREPVIPAGGERLFYRDAAFSTIEGVLGRRSLIARNTSQDPLEKIGYEVFGPLFTGFLLWLATLAQRNRPEKILLFARDTHFVRQHFHRFLAPLGVEAEIDYLYVSRGSLLFASLTDFQPSRLWHLFSGRSHKTVGEHLRRLGLPPEPITDIVQSAGFESLDEIVSNGEPRMHRLLTKLYDPLLVESARRRPLPRKYLEQRVGDARRLMLVDIGWVGNMQSSFLRLLEPLTGQLQVRGCYVGLHGSARENDYPGHTMEGWLTHYGEPDGMEQKVWWAGGVELLEFAMCAPHGTTLGYELADGGQVQPVLESSEVDAGSTNLSARLQRGAGRFLEDYLTTFAGIPLVALNSRVWANEFYRLVTQPTREEAELLGDLTHSDAAGHTRRRLPLAMRFQADDPRAISDALERSYWKAGFRVRNGLAEDPA